MHVTRQPAPGEVWTFVLISWVEVIFLSQKKPASQVSQSGIDRAQHVTQQCPRAWGSNRSIKITLALVAQRPMTLAGPGRRQGSGQSQKFGPPVGTGRPAGGVLLCLFLNPEKLFCREII